MLRFRHNDIEHLRSLLEKNSVKRFSRILIVTESVFSVDGDKCDIDSLVDLSEEFGAILIVDEAHATGVIGKRGMGLTCGKKVDITIGTFGKACGSFGAYIACSEEIRSFLINCCSGFIYTTAIPPSVVGSIDAALDIIPTMDNERRDIKNKSGFLRSSLKSIGFSTGESTSHIIPVIMGDEECALNTAEYLEENGILAVAIRPPTVPEGKSRIRLAVSALHGWKHLKHVAKTFERLLNEYEKLSQKNIHNGYRYRGR